MSNSKPSSHFDLPLLPDRQPIGFAILCAIVGAILAVVVCIDASRLPLTP